MGEDHCSNRPHNLQRKETDEIGQQLDGIDNKGHAPALITDIHSWTHLLDITQDISGKMKAPHEKLYHKYGL